MLGSAGAGWGLSGRLTEGKESPGGESMLKHVCSPQEEGRRGIVQDIFLFVENSQCNGKLSAEQDQQFPKTKTSHACPNNLVHPKSFTPQR